VRGARFAHLLFVFALAAGFMPGCGRAGAGVSDAEKGAEANRASAPAGADPHNEVEPGAGGGLERGRVVTPSGRSFDVEVVADPPLRERGLKYRASVPEGSGMLFVFPVAGRHRFWMYECRTALDIIWIDAHRRIVHVAPSLQPCAKLPCPDYGPEDEALYVLEVGPGVAARAGIKQGQTVTLLFAHPPNPS
jgi:uncharacterized membrane protein (UPF0127 family)